jgi:hypothetical protein
MEVIFNGGHLPHFQNFGDCFEMFWGRPLNVTKQVVLISCYFTTSLGRQTGGRAGGCINQ